MADNNDELAKALIGGNAMVPTAPLGFSPWDRFRAADQAANQMLPGFLGVQWPGHGLASFLMGLPPAIAMGASRNATGAPTDVQTGMVSGNPSWASIWANELAKRRGEGNK